MWGPGIGSEMGGRWGKLEDTMCKSELRTRPLSCIIPDQLLTPGEKKTKHKL